MFTTATTNTTASTMGDDHASTLVTCRTILNAGLQLQGKDQLNRQMEEWQRRMDAHKQVERTVTANKLTFERTLRMMEMGARQVTVQDQPQFTSVSDNALLMNPYNQIMVPIFVNIPTPLHMTFHSPAHVMTSLPSPYEDQQGCQLAKQEYDSNDQVDIPNIPLPQEYISANDYQSSWNNWLQWHRTMPPTPYMKSESVSDHQLPASYDPSLMQLDYLPFTSEDDISKINTEPCMMNTLQISHDNDEEDEFNVIL